MAASLGNTAYGAIFYTAPSSPPTYTPVLEIASIDFKGFTIPPIDLTHLLSPNATEELTPGILHPGTIDMTGNFIGDATQLAFITFAQAQAVFPWKITSPVQKGAKEATFTGLCFVTSYDVGPFEANKKIDIKVNVQTTGTVVLTIA